MRSETRQSALSVLSRERSKRLKQEETESEDSKFQVSQGHIETGLYQT